MGHWLRVIVKVSDTAGDVQGWLVGPDTELEVIPGAGDLLSFDADRAAPALSAVLGPGPFVVQARHFRTEVEQSGGLVARIVVGAQAEELELLRRTDEWLDFSTAAAGCVYGGCTRDLTREADSALWTCTTSGHNLCLGCDRPVRASAVYCAYHDASEF